MFCNAAVIFPTGFNMDHIGGEPYQLPSSYQVGISYIFFVLALWITVISELFAGKVCLPHFWQICENVISCSSPKDIWLVVFLKNSTLWKCLLWNIPLVNCLPIEETGLASRKITTLLSCHIFCCLPQGRGPKGKTTEVRYRLWVAWAGHCWRPISLDWYCWTIAVHHPKGDVHISGDFCPELNTL